MSSEQLKRAREDAGLSREELADAMGVSTRSVYRWEIGETPITSVIELALENIFTGLKRAMVRK